jgi:serine/threonine protein kinase
VGADDLIAAVAAAILDGRPVDWAALEADASTEDRLVLDELRVLCAVANLHRGGTPEPRPPAAGRTSWGRLRIIGFVGAGTFGEVYRAWDPRLDREVALKVIPAATADGARSAEILREGRLLARVRHPSVVAIYDAEEIASEVGLTMEFIEGATLEDLLSRQHVFGPADTVDAGIQLAGALAAAHAAGVLHRDIKAANVIRRADGRIVLTDFGAASWLEDQTAAGGGTPLYLAPEVLRGAGATVRSDLYSLGVLLYRLRTGSYPVEAPSLEDLKRAHEVRTSQQPPPPAGRGALLRLDDVIARAIDPRPEHRHESAEALAADLRRSKLGLSDIPRRPETAWWLLGIAAVRLKPGANILGRDPEADVWFDRPGISRHHARIEIAGTEAVIEDLGSRNGTWVQGVRITALTPLRDGDRIRLGDLEVTVRARQTAQSTETL